MSASVRDPKLADREDRDRACLRLDRNVIVEAGAGTGKTTLLTDRALLLILGAGVGVGEIVALTFTEKAAGEIRWRLGERLLELAAFCRGETLPEAALRRCEGISDRIESVFRVGREKALRRALAAVEDMDKAAIGTLHSFAARILRAYPLQAGVAPAFTVDPGELFDELFEGQWAVWLDEELGESAPRERDWIAVLRLAPLSSLAELARSLCSPRVGLDGALNGPAGMECWLRETLSTLRGEPRRQPKARGNIELRLAAAADRLESLLNGAAKLPMELPELELPGASWPAGWDEANRERCETAFRLAERCCPEREALLRAAVELVAPFCRRLRRLYAWRGLVSFDGLLTSARDLVRDHPDVREELKGRWRAFLVDEFQDTDPLQGELLFYLSERKGLAAKDWRQALLEPGKLFVVGDPKQSVYRFRGADLSAYEGFLERLKGQEPPALECVLKTNFRSHAGILDPVNEVVGRLMERVEGSQPAYRPIAPASGRIPEGGGVELAVVGAQGEKLSMGAVRRAEALWLADWIEAWRAPRGERRLKDIAVLLRTTTPLEAYLDVLKERAIPYVVEAERHFYGTQEVLDFLNLLRALDDPEDRVALVGLLRSPLVGLTDAELLAVAGGGFDYMKARVPRGVQGASRERMARFFAVLRGLRRRVGRVPLAELLTAILAETQPVELLSEAYHGEQTASNLLKLARLAREASDAHGLTLSGFVGRIQRAVAEAREEGESPLADEQIDAVRILTIHKAKGLEFPVVIVGNLSGGLKVGGDGPVLRVDWGGRGCGLRLPRTADGAAALWLEARERRREEDEAVRLLYVAMTRAKERLILLGARKPAPHSLAAMLAGAGAWPQRAGRPSKEILPAEASAPRRALKPRETEASLGDLRELAARWKKRAASRDAIQSLPRHASPSSLTLPADPHLAGTDADSARLIGTVCHKVLERWDFARGGDILREIGSAHEGLSFDFPHADWRSIRAECESILSRFLVSAPARALARADILGREIPFVYGENGTVVRGEIDLLYRRDGKLFVADYKTDAVRAGGVEAAAQRYAGQTSAYREAVRRTLGVPEVGATLIFLRACKEAPAP